MFYGRIKLTHCLDCENRCIGCQSKCEHYKEYREKLEEMKRNKIKNNEYNAYIHENKFVSIRESGYRG